MKIICIGRNYAEHARELNNPLPKEPVFFMKPETAVFQDQDFYLPDFTKDLHHEIELVLRISKTGKHIGEAHAHKYYDKIGLGIDFTARDLQAECKKNGLPWEKAKAFDNSAPVGRLVPKEDVLGKDIQFELKINGEVRQKGISSDMIFSFDQIIAYVSRFVTLKAGDLIYTGTPEGVGPVKIGDQLEGFLNGEPSFSFRIR